GISGVLVAASSPSRLGGVTPPPPSPTVGRDVTSSNSAVLPPSNPAASFGRWVAMLDPPPLQPATSPSSAAVNSGTDQLLSSCAFFHRFTKDLRNGCLVLQCHDRFQA